MTKTKLQLFFLCLVFGLPIAILGLDFYKNNTKQFEVGQCITYWNKQETVVFTVKILSVKEKSYDTKILAEIDNKYHMFLYKEVKFKYNSIYRVVPCPSELLQ